MKKLLVVSCAVLSMVGVVIAERSAAAEIPLADRDARGGGEIAECIAAGSTVPNDAIVDRLPVSRPDTPQTEFQLECGPPEIVGARHIHAGHPINSVLSFQACYQAALLRGQRIPQQYSSLYSYQTLGGPIVEVATDDFSPFILTAYTKGPNSADWENCAAHAR